MLLIGLTGSIATGKSTVSNLLSSPPYSLPLIDADVLAREVVLPGTPAYRKIVAHFGPTTPDLLLPSSPPSFTTPNDTSTNPPPHTKRKERPLDRAALGRRVFGSQPSRQKDRAILNSIIHPAVRRAILKKIIYYHLLGHWAVILDIPLLYESALDPYVSFVLLIASTPETQLQRLSSRDPHLSVQEGRDRVGSQMGIWEKVGRTESRGAGRGTVVWNEGSKTDLERRVGEVMGRLERERRGLWAWWLWGSPYVAVGVAGWEVWKGWEGRREWERKKRLESEVGVGEEEDIRK